MIGSIVIARDPTKTNRPHIERTLSPKTGWKEGTYRHEIRAMGGFWNCSFDMLGSYVELVGFMDRAIGGHVETYSDTGQLCWEGFINTLILHAYGKRVELSFDNMANTIKMYYQLAAVGDNYGSTVQERDAEIVARLMGDVDSSATTQKSADIYSTESRAKYGVKDKALSGGVLSGAGVATQIGNLYIAKYAFPQKTVAVESNAPDAPYLEVICQGYWQRLNWRDYYKAVGGTETISANIARIVTDEGEYVASSKVATNATLVPITNTANRYTGDILLDIARLGDGSNNRYIIGMWEGRKLIYQQSVTNDIESATYYMDIRGTDIYYQGQTVVQPCELRPNHYLRITDAEPFKVKTDASLDADPNAIYVENIVYNERGDSFKASPARGDQSDVFLIRSGMGNSGIF